ncbi:MCE family protein [Mycobacterium sp. SMC-18]|uniref:MCE family protein n=1 Tax=unclassified Mycobacterium TaxID=2642494 RepID=UPI003875C681
MPTRARDQRIHPALWTLILVGVIGLFVYVTMAQFAGSFTRYVPVTVTSDRAGLVMDAGARVKLRGVQVGRVSAIQADTGAEGTAVRLRLELDPGQVGHIPANVRAEIRATTLFGAKYVDLVMPKSPSVQHISSGAVIPSDNVSTEVNTVFQNLYNLLGEIDPAKLNSTLTALADGLRGEGQAIGQSITDYDEVLKALNPRADTIRAGWQSLRGYSQTYGATVPDIVSILDSVTTTSAAITDNARALDALLLNVTGLAHSGTSLFAPNKENFVTAINALQPTTSLLLKYNPELTCLIVGGKYYLDHGGYQAVGGNGRSTIIDAALLLGDDPYKYPDNLPVVGAKGGPDGKPGCGSLPDVAKNWPVRQLVTNTGWGSGVDWRPNPGIGFPGWANYFPVTRAVPEPPSVRNSDGGPAPGPIPYAGAPAYGAPLYAPDGNPLYPGLPPAPQPGTPREPGPPPPGTEPFTVLNPAALQPTPQAPPPTPAVPSP